MKMMPYTLVRRSFVHEGRIYHYYDPSFFHPFGQDNYSRNPLNHEYRGSFTRHRAVENILLFLRVNILGEFLGDDNIFYKYLDSILSIFFGLNCSFPLIDVGRYTVWALKGQPIHKLEVRPK